MVRWTHSAFKGLTLSSSSLILLLLNGKEPCVCSSLCLKGSDLQWHSEILELKALNIECVWSAKRASLPLCVRFPLQEGGSASGTDGCRSLRLLPGAGGGRGQGSCWLLPLETLLSLCWKLLLSHMTRVPWRWRRRRCLPPASGAALWFLPCLPPNLNNLQPKSLRLHLHHRRFTLTQHIHYSRVGTAGQVSDKQFWFFWVTVSETQTLLLLKKKTLLTLSRLHSISCPMLLLLWWSNSATVSYVHADSHIDSVCIVFHGFFWFRKLPCQIHSLHYQKTPPGLNQRRCPRSLHHYQ